MTSMLWRTAAIFAALALTTTTAAAAPEGARSDDPQSVDDAGISTTTDASEEAEVAPQTLFREGEEAYWLGDFDLAIERFEAAYARSRLPGMLYNVGLAYYRRYDLSLAVADLERARVVFTNYLQADVAGLIAPAHVQGLIDEIDGKIAAVRAIESAAPAPTQTADADEAENCVDPAPLPAPGDRRDRQVGGALLGVGALSVVGGAVAAVAFSLKGAEFSDTLVLLDRQRSEAGCTTPASSSLCADLDAALRTTEANGHKANLLAATLGGSLIGVGAGLVVAGSVLLGRARGRSASARDLAIAPTWGGLTVRGRF